MSTATLTDHSPQLIRRSQKEEWYCSDCSNNHDGALPDSRTVYLTADVVNAVDNYYDSGYLDTGFKIDPYSIGAEATEIIDCPVSGWSKADECFQVDGGLGWECPNCENEHQTAHEARDCCLIHEIDDPYDNCLSTCRIDEGTKKQGWSYCWCDGPDGNCTVMVCLTCHVEGRHINMDEHVKIHQEDDPSYDEPVDKVEVGGPEHLPPAYEYTEEPTPPAAGCTICSGPFCCEFHGIHKTPHRGHAR